MDDRQEGYRRKLFAITEELESLPDDREDLNLLERKGLLHGVQVAVDATMDLAAMKVKDLGIEVLDDYHNVDVLGERGVLDATLAAKIKDLNGLRNAIVHKYNRFEERTVLENLDEIKEVLFEFARRVEETL